MIDELLAILGVEAALLVFIATMTLRQRQMDVLSGRYFERPLVPPDDGSDRPRRIPARARALRRGTKTSAAIARIQLFKFSPKAGLRRTLRRVLQRVMIRSRRPDKSATRTPSQPARFVMRLRIQRSSAGCAQADCRNPLARQAHHRKLSVPSSRAPPDPAAIRAGRIEWFGPAS
jgi:hypothetical protein